MGSMMNLDNTHKSAKQLKQETSSKCKMYMPWEIQNRKNKEENMAKVIKRGNKYRVVDPKTNKLTRNKAGTPVDGGGFASKAKAQRQANAIEASESKK